MNASIQGGSNVLREVVDAGFVAKCVAIGTGSLFYSADAVLFNYATNVVVTGSSHLKVSL